MLLSAPQPTFYDSSKPRLSRSWARGSGTTTGVAAEVHRLVLPVKKKINDRLVHVDGEWRPAGGSGKRKRADEGNVGERGMGRGEGKR